MRGKHDLIRAISLVALLNGSAFAMLYSGDAATDFGAYPYTEVLDGTSDVGIPAGAPEGTISGWDVARALFWLDMGGNQLHVGIEFVGIGGDADGDGVDGLTSPWLTALGGLDFPDLAFTESICICFDFDMDGQSSLIAGAGANDGAHRVSTFAGSENLMAFGFLTEQPQCTGPHFYAPGPFSPDYELTIDGIDQLAVFVDNTITFRFNVFAGSYQDDGVGEDCLCGIVTLDGRSGEARVAPVATEIVRAWPNPFNPSTTLEVGLEQAGPASLTVYNLMGQPVRTLVDGLLPAGRSQVRFDAEGLPSGLYLARFESEQGVHVQRLLLTR